MAHRFMGIRCVHSLPTRHSRHLPPPIAYGTELQDLTEELLTIKFPLPPFYEQGLSFTSQKMWHELDPILQKGEYVLRGHAACIPRTLHHDPRRNSSSSSEDSPTRHIAQMKAILNRFQDEGLLYMERVQQRRYAVVTASYYSQQKDTTATENTNSIHEEDSSSFANKVELKCATPGPTVEMWDTLLDSMAVTPTHDTPTTMFTILQHVLSRHDKDGGFERNINPYTVPTICTFNTVLRGVASTPYNNINTTNNNKEEEDTRVRDSALETAFGVYDDMRFHVNRNAATYRYMIQVVHKFLPPSKTRGNIAYALWKLAQQEHVASQEVLNALLDVSSSNQNHNPELQDWIETHGNNIRHMPLNWRKNYKLRRYITKDATY